MTNEEKLPAPPYVAFRTLANFLDWLGEVGVPDRIDRSFWGQKLSGGYGAQLMAALRFFDLISEDDAPERQLEEMVSDPERRKEILRDLIQVRYRDAISGLDLERATAGQLAERFRRFNVSGETLRKAIMFFVHAAQYCEIPVSPHITRPGRVVKATGGGTARKRLTPRTRELPQERPELVRERAFPDVEALGLHPTIEAMLRDLNSRGSNWEVAERQKWIDAFLAVMEYAYPAK